MGLRRPRAPYPIPVLILGVSAASTLVSGAARAQSIMAASMYGTREVGGVDAGVSTRLLNPYGINYADCINDVALEIPVELSSFPGTDTMQVWATYGSDCVFSGRGMDGTGATCWLVDPGPGLPSGSLAYTASIPVRALVAPENGTIPPAGTLEGDQSASACLNQQSYAGVPVTLYFLPIQSDGTVDPSGTPYLYPTFTADLVAPPPPSAVTIEPGDTIYTVTWTPNADSDTQGYDVFIDPPPGSHPEGGTGVIPTVSHCLQTGTTIEAGDDGDDGSADGSSPDGAADDVAVVDATLETGALESSMEASDDASLETSAPEASVDGMSETSTPDSSGATDASEVPDVCITANGGGSAPAAQDSGCASTALAATPVFVAGYATETTDDSGTGATGFGGIASLTCAYLEGGSCSGSSPAYMNTGSPSVTGASVSQLVITGLTNGVTYNIVVAAVDGSGNVGPQSGEQCNYPAPINDFYQTYRLDGGGAGGGFCTLEAVGAPTGASVVSMGFGALAFGLARRRRKRP
jgi:hypothetical protein